MNEVCGGETKDDFILNSVFAAEMIDEYVDNIVNQANDDFEQWMKLSVQSDTEIKPLHVFWLRVQNQLHCCGKLKHYIL